MVQVDQQQTPQAQMGRRIFRATSVLMVIQVILKGFGIIEKSILGHLFGTTYLTDAYSQARDIANYGFQMVDQVVMHSFLPVFVQRMREHGEEDAWRLVSTVTNVLAPVMLLAAILAIIFTPDILPFFAPGWFAGKVTQDPNLIPLTIKLARMMLVAVVFLATSSLTYCVLNSYKEFAKPHSAELALRVTVIIFAVLFARSWGPTAMVVGFVCGAIAKLAVHATFLGGKVKNYRPVIDLKHPGVKEFWTLALPLLLGVTFSIVRQVMDNRFTSDLSEGSLAAVKFARTLCDGPVNIFPFVFGIAMFPFLYDIAASGDKVRLREMFMSATRMMLLIFIPLGAVIILLREPLVLAVFGEKSLKVTFPLQIYAIQMLAGALEIIVLQFFFAMKDTMRPTMIGIAMVPLHICVSYLGVYYWHLGMVGIALALLVSKSTKVVILYGMMRRKLDTLEARRTLVLLGKMAVALVAMMIIILPAVHFLPSSKDLAVIIKHALPMIPKKLTKVCALLPIGLAGVLGLVAYYLVLQPLRVEEVNMLTSKVLGKQRKKSAAA